MRSVRTGSEGPLSFPSHSSTPSLPPRYVQELGRHNYVTPTSYLELISSFKSLIGSKRGLVTKMKKRYEVGLEKLAFAASQVRKGRGEGGRGGGGGKGAEEEGDKGEKKKGREWESSKGGRRKRRRGVGEGSLGVKCKFHPHIPPSSISHPHTPTGGINAKRTGGAPAEAGDSS